jgi:hypothetical protein
LFNSQAFLIGDMFISYDRYNMWLRNPCTQDASDNQFINKVKSCNALLCVLLVCTRSYVIAKYVARGRRRKIWALNKLAFLHLLLISVISSCEFHHHGSPVQFIAVGAELT